MMRTVIAAVGVALAVFSAAPAHADDDRAERVYLSALDSEHIYYPSAADAIEIAHSICDYLDAGGRRSAAVGSAESYWTAYETAFVVGAATQAFCPEHSDDPY